MRIAVIALLLGGLLGGCAFTPHNVVITATSPTAHDMVGNGTVVALEVLDDRDDLVVGQRGVGMQGADITASEVMPTLSHEVAGGLEARGFKVVKPQESASAIMEVRLRAFKFFIESGFWTGAINTSVVIGVEAQVGPTVIKRVYRSSAEENTMVVPGASEIDTKLNAAFSDVLGQLMNDHELMAFLAGSSRS